MFIIELDEKISLLWPDDDLSLVSFRLWPQNGCQSGEEGNSGRTWGESWLAGRGPGDPVGSQREACPTWDLVPANVAGSPSGREVLPGGWSRSCARWWAWANARTPPPYCLILSIQRESKAASGGHNGSWVPRESRCQCLQSRGSRRRRQRLVAWREPRVTGDPSGALRGGRRDWGELSQEGKRHKAVENRLFLLQ